MSAQSIILGEGVFSIGNVDIALTRGGGKFVIEREYKRIEADGDYGDVKGRIRKIKSIPKLTINTLELLPENLPKMYAGMKYTANKLTGKADIEEEDYQDTVSFTGKTKGGRSVKITVKNAINLENFDWSMVDKDEIVAALTYTGTYLDSAREIEPWDIEWID